MWLFRKSLDLRRAVARPVVAADLAGVSRLLRDGSRRFYGVSGTDLTALLEAERGVVLDADGELFGVVLVSMPVGATCWLRAVALAEGVELRAALDRLLTPLHARLREWGVATIFFSGDESVEGWLLPLLRQHGYTIATEVVVYEKTQLEIPDGGNREVEVRPAGAAELPEVLRIDRASFEPQWTKDDEVLGAAALYGPYFVVAELDGAVVGYAYATTHFGGRLVHLVRIAVEPTRRGQGVGVRLLADLTAFAQDAGASLITLNTQAYNRSAQRLYEWFGFHATGERQIVLSCTIQGG
jgi:ribosomal protein S18 acetylase RimI-like enzyme